MRSSGRASLSPRVSPAAAVVLLAAAATAQNPFAAASHDEAVPTLAQVAGHDFGERITTPEQTTRYLQALAAASPRATLFRYGETWEGRPLHYLAIAGPDTDLDAVREGMAALADPRQVAGDLLEVQVRTLPAVVWLAYAVHGDEISGTDAALRTAYHLLAARGEPVAELAREHCVVIVDPLQNPDGRARFVHHYRQTRGRWPDADDQAAEHDQPWPGGRTNHALFDMNRDWFALTQPESRGRVAAFLQWYPLVYVDLHEMGSDATYYFPPPAVPLNPEFTVEQRRWLDVFGKSNARRFDEAGYAYFVRDVFDAFYPGYGEGWPMFHGAIGMTYEQASARGLVIERDDDTLLRYGDAVEHHFVASLATIETAARHRQELLSAFLEHRREACRAPAGGEVVEYLFPPGRDPGRVLRLVELLRAQGVEVWRASEAFTCPSARPLAGGAPGERTFPAGTYSVRVAQPAGRLAHTLLARHRPMGEEFVEEQERRRQKRLRTEIYDVTAWSLPLLFDLDCVEATAASPGTFEPVVEAPLAEGRVPAQPARIAYLLPWGTNAAGRALAAMLREGLRVRVTDEPFVQAGTSFPRGTVIVRVAENAPDLHERLVRIARGSGATFHGTDTGWVEEGAGFGANHVRWVEPPSVALAWDRPTRAYSAGWARYVLEHAFGYPVTPVRTHRLRRAELERYDVLVLPASRGYGEALAGVEERIVDWVEAGGTLVTLGEASRWLTGESVGLLASEPESRAKPEGDKARLADEEAEEGDEDEHEAREEEPPQPFDLERAVQPEEEPPDRTPGAILRVELDPEHWLAFGYDGHARVLANTRNIFTPVKLDEGRNVGVYAPAEELVVSGLVWKESRRQLARKAYLVHQPTGRGHVVAFAEDPNFRAFQAGLELLFLNAVLLAPRE